MRRSLPSHLTPAYPYLELSSVVVVCGTLSALLQRDEREASEIRRAGCQEDHCKGGESVRVCVNLTETQGHATRHRVATDDVVYKACNSVSISVMVVNRSSIPP